MPKQFDPQTEIPDLKGKVIVITGGEQPIHPSLYRQRADHSAGNAGLGAETIRQLAAHNPATIYLCARSLQKADIFMAEIKQAHPSINIKPIHFDLSSLESAKAAAAQVLDATDRIDMLILNAGVAGMAPALTKEGYEYQFGVNHVAHALFTQHLMPLILESAYGGKDIRIITVSSEAAKLFSPKAGIVLPELKTTMASYAAMSRYGQSKLANALFSKKLAQLYPSITCVAIHPGFVKTEIAGKMTGPAWMGVLVKPLAALMGVTVQDGAKTQLWAATSRDAQTGRFYYPIGKLEKVPYENDEKKVDEFWKWTEDELRLHGGKEWPTAA